MTEAFKPANPAFADRVRRSFARQGFMAYLGAELTRVEPGFCEIVLPYQPQLTQQHGFFHAGVVGTLADNSGGYAGFSLLSADTSILTVEYKLNLLAPAQGERLTARGRVLKAGRTIIAARCQVFALDQGREKLVAHCLMTLMALAGRSDRPQG
ncbi:MAG: PaaI family thioesterase [Proteobacteria bacterium]|nr:PaaI family thioesterase [Pseudomonadota bacterium]MBU2467379.1 PaaI family thioesterase [Pseudomonadota bacterium]MBU2517059.1 PaaI family thioesterase [Pseudomonadota bacterium]